MDFSAPLPQDPVTFPPASFMFCPNPATSHRWRFTQDGFFSYAPSRSHENAPCVKTINLAPVYVKHGLFLAALQQTPETHICIMRESAPHAFALGSAGLRRPLQQTAHVGAEHQPGQTYCMCSSQSPCYMPGNKDGKRLKIDMGL